MVICRRDWIALDKYNVKKSYSLIVSAPQKNDMAWSVKISIAGKEDNIFGDDSWQALQLAFFFIRSEVEALEGVGWQFFDEKDERRVSAREF